MLPKLLWMQIAGVGVVRVAEPLDTSKLGPVRLPPHNEFQEDFKELMLQVRRMAAKHNLPTPAIVFGHPWQSPIKRMTLEMQSDPMTIGPRKFADVEFTYGRLGYELVVR